MILKVMIFSGVVFCIQFFGFFLFKIAMMMREHGSYFPAKGEWGEYLTIWAGIFLAFFVTFTTGATIISYLLLAFIS